MDIVALNRDNSRESSITIGLIVALKYHQLNELFLLPEAQQERNHKHQSVHCSQQPRLVTNHDLGREKSGDNGIRAENFTKTFNGVEFETEGIP